MTQLEQDCRTIRRELLLLPVRTEIVNTDTWEEGQQSVVLPIELRDRITRALSPSPDLEEALFAIADGEGDAQTIARQTLEANGLGVPCEDEGCPQHGTRHICFNRTALATTNAEGTEND